MILSFLQRIAEVLLSRAFWTVIGFILLALVVWLIGPLLAIGEMRPLETQASRIWFIVAVAGLLLLRWLIGRWRRSATNAGVTERLRALLQSARIEESDDVKLLRARFNEALAILRRARFGERQGGLGRWVGRRRYLYELPWYIIIGAPGAGKTTALLNSGLNFPLAKSLGKGAVKGVGGTRNCDWWFTNQAVLIDTAGRYTTHDSDAEADKSEWQGFMGLLRKSRSSQPINGVLLTISVTELLDSSPDARRQHAETLRQRLDDLREDLGIAFPVYLLINKCDLLSGFDEYFASLDRAGREQVWGFTLPWEEGAPAQVYPQDTVQEELGLLASRIQAGLVDLLQAEPELARRNLIHSFPQQFALLCETLREVGALLFVDSRFSSAPMLRGMYFTSATQEGTPLDRVISAMGGQAAESVAAARPRGAGKSHFLQELLTRVVFAEAHLAGHNRKVDRRARTLHITAYAASVLVLAGAVAVWVNSYRNNLTYLAEVDGKVDRLAAKLDELPPGIDGNLYPLLAPLTESETAADSVQFRAIDPLQAWTFGLYQGEKLRAGSWPLYEKLLRTRLAPSLEARLEWLLRTVAVEDLEFAYEILKAYLMLHDPARFDAGAFKAFVLADWDRNMPTGAAQPEREALSRHLDALLTLGGTLAVSEVDNALVESTRARLTQYSFAQRTYRRLVRTLEHNDLPTFSIGAVVGPSAPSVFRHRSGRPLTDGVPSLYTYRGYHELFMPGVDGALRHVGKDDAWVLGVSDVSAREQAQAIASGELALEVKRLYMWDYVAVWERFLDDMDIVTPHSLSAVTGLVKVLSSTDSPLSRLMKAVVEETTLLRKNPQNPGGTDASLLERVRRTARATQDDVTRIVGPNMMPGRLGPREVPELIVDNRFSELRRVVGTGDGAGPLAGTIQSLSELHLFLSSVEAAKSGGYPPPTSDLPARLKAEADRMPLPGKRLLESLAGAGGTMVARETRAAKSNEMVGTVTRACRETIQGRYPFAAAGQEVQADDFARMFGPGGVIDSYFQRELGAAVDTSTSPWRLRPGAQGGLGEGGVLAQFERAAVIKDVFFRSGAGTPTVTLLIKPIEMDTTITNFVLDIDGQVIRYQHGPQVGHTVRWPGERGSRQVRVSVEPVLDDARSGLVLEGAWALHRLFDNARIVPGSSPEQFRAVLDVGGRKVELEVKASSVRNPFALQEMRQFTCPAGL